MSTKKLTLKTAPRREIAVDCLRNKLYIKGWALSTALGITAIVPRRNKIAAAYNRDIPVAVMVIFPWKSVSWVMCYVHPDYRRQGIGTRLFKRLLKTYRLNKQNLTYSKGKRGGIKFFERFNITRDDT